MCDFKVGDEVVCVKSIKRLGMVGSTYVVQSVFLSPKGRAGICLVGEDNGARHGPPGFYGYAADNFRKVQRRDLGAWLKTATKFEEPKRVKQDA